MTRARRAFLIGLCCWILAMIISLQVGSVADADLDLIIQLRLPRAILATAIGIGLSVAGASLQAIFSNPLCEPYTLGISSGATLGAVIGVSLGAYFGPSSVGVFSFAGAMLFATILHVISRHSRPGSQTLLLSGVMLGFLGSSLVALWMALSDANGIQGAVLWLMGNLSRARLDSSLMSWTGVVGIAFLVWARWRDLDALLLGEESAAALGVSVVEARRRIVFLVSLLVALCVSGGGMIGFVGLMVPHFARRWVGSLHLALLPVSAIWGATLLTVADAVARRVAAPYELPVGVITALLGAPLFLWIVSHRERGRS